MWKCRTCGEPIGDTWVFLGFSRCYSCLDEEASAVREAAQQVKEDQLYRIKQEGNQHD